MTLAAATLRIFAMSMPEQQKIDSKIKKSTKRLMSCVPKTLRRAFDDELENLVSLKVRQHMLVSPLEIRGFSPD